MKFYTFSPFIKNYSFLLYFSKKYLLCLFLFILFSPISHAQKISAHRGDQSTAPENTIPAIKNAIKEGAPQIEIDVKITSDGVLVLMHDETVDRTTDGNGKVSDLSYERIRDLDAGSWFSSEYKNLKVPTLKEALEIIPSEIPVNVHIHQGIRLVNNACKIIIETKHLENSFITLNMNDFEEMASARLTAPNIKLRKGFPADSTVTEKDIFIPEKYFSDKDKSKMINRKIDFFQLFGKPVSPDQLSELVSRLHKYGVTVNYFCANKKEEFFPLIDAGVDFILTDNTISGIEIINQYKNGK